MYQLITYLKKKFLVYVPTLLPTLPTLLPTFQKARNKSVCVGSVGNVGIFNSYKKKYFYILSTT